MRALLLLCVAMAAFALMNMGCAASLDGAARFAIALDTAIPAGEKSFATFNGEREKALATAPVEEVKSYRVKVAVVVTAFAIATQAAHDVKEAIMTAVAVKAKTVDAVVLLRGACAAVISLDVASKAIQFEVPGLVVLVPACR